MSNFRVQHVMVVCFFLRCPFIYAETFSDCESISVNFLVGYLKNFQKWTVLHFCLFCWKSQTHCNFLSFFEFHDGTGPSIESGYITSEERQCFGLFLIFTWISSQIFHVLLSPVFLNLFGSLSSRLGRILKILVSREPF